MGCKGQFKHYDADGRYIAGGDLHLPDELDWMQIEVKSHWFRYMGMGPREARYTLFSSQGEQRLLTGMALTPLDHKQYQERLDGSRNEVQKFIEEGGYSRVPRNQ
jgi:hypothetical protein